MEPLLRINSLSGGYYNKKVIENVSLEVNRGDFLGIIGPNGSGKTTLLRLISKILKPAKGEIFLEGENISSLSLKEFSRKCAFVSQEALISFSFSVSEVVLMGRIPHLTRLAQETSKDLRIAEDALISTDSLDLKYKNINELSAGERQRVIIARALAQEPKLLFLDEPTSHLDIAHQIQILDLLKKLNRQNSLTVVMVIHDLNLASEYCSRIIMLDNGSTYKDGSPEEVLTYQNIENVYKTVVLVNENPLSKRPYVLLVPKIK